MLKDKYNRAQGIGDLILNFSEILVYCSVCLQFYQSNFVCNVTCSTFSAQIVQLESQLVETSRKAEEQVNLSLDASSILQRSAEYTEEDVEGLEKKVRKLTREVDMLRVEVDIIIYWILFFIIT